MGRMWETLSLHNSHSLCTVHSPKSTSVTFWTLDQHTSRHISCPPHAHYIHNPCFFSSHVSMTYAISFNVPLDGSASFSLFFCAFWYVFVCHVDLTLFLLSLAVLTLRVSWMLLSLTSASTHCCSGRTCTCFFVRWGSIFSVVSYPRAGQSHPRSCLLLSKSKLSVPEDCARGELMLLGRLPAHRCCARSLELLFEDDASFYVLRGATNVSPRGDVVTSGLMAWLGGSTSLMAREVLLWIPRVLFHLMDALDFLHANSVHHLGITPEAAPPRFRAFSGNQYDFL